MRALVVNNLNKNYPGFSLKDINFSLDRGNILGIIGENGSGKTTLLKCILDIVKFHGEILFEEEKINSKIKNNFGVYLDSGFLNANLTPIQVNSILKDAYSTWDEEEYFRILDKFNIPRDKKINKFSKGMAVRVKLATCFCHNAKLLILDEPTAGLDPVANDEVLEMIFEYTRDENHTVIISSHITSDLEELADEILYIDNGELIFKMSMENIGEEFAIGRATEEDFNKIDRAFIKKYIKESYGYEFLIVALEKFKKEYPNIVVEDIDLKKLMVMYKKGVDR